MVVIIVYGACIGSRFIGELSLYFSSAALGDGGGVR